MRQDTIKQTNKNIVLLPHVKYAKLKMAEMVFHHNHIINSWYPFSQPWQGSRQNIFINVCLLRLVWACASVFTDCFSFLRKIYSFGHLIHQKFSEWKTVKIKKKKYPLIRSISSSSDIIITDQQILKDFFSFLFDILKKKKN